MSSKGYLNEDILSTFCKRGPFSNKWAPFWGFSIMDLTQKGTKKVLKMYSFGKLSTFWEPFWAPLAWFQCLSAQSIWHMIFSFTLYKVKFILYCKYWLRNTGTLCKVVRFFYIQCTTKFCELWALFRGMEYLKSRIKNLENLVNFWYIGIGKFWVLVAHTSTLLCTPPNWCVRNSVPLPIEVSGILYPSLWSCQEFYAPP